MNKLINSLLIFTLLASSCRKDNDHISPPPCIEKEEIQDSTSNVIGNPFFYNPHGEAFCTKVNQLTWFEPIALKYKNDSSTFYLILFGTNKDSILVDELRISRIPLKIGCFEINALDFIASNNNLYASYKNIDHDIVIDRYILDTSAINKISVSAIDTISKTITGYFAVSFVFKNDRPKRNPFNPYRMRFFNGYFKGKYE